MAATRASKSASSALATPRISRPPETAASSHAAMSRFLLLLLLLLFRIYREGIAHYFVCMYVCMYVCKYVSM